MLKQVKTPRQFINSSQRQSEQTKSDHRQGLVADGTRFLKDGHWWEIDAHVSGKYGPYYRCHPVCNIESRFFAHHEISQALTEEKTMLASSMKPPSRDVPTCSGDRGSGRLGELVPISQAHVKLSHTKRKTVKNGNSECKLLAIGTPAGIKATIQNLHNLGFAHTTDWSSVQRKPRSDEFMSIFTGRKV
ncbi:hypothetical protein [Halomicronema sp. CCY15110]|uniref:hypothetical protein n=1 Tax=Halomicronema sp. CCY15110 TaxID=2767773 RepID=UPI00194DD0F3|nr:hypothetical protein [Halomicronema sp. CCY15110]